MNVNEVGAGRRAQQSEATREELVRVARELFGERGYAAVPTEEIVGRAGVTRGALYHHFKDKRDLFRAVFVAVEEELAAKIFAAALTEPDPWRQQTVALGAFLDACLEPGVQRITLVDAPSVLGIEAWREIEADYGLALVRAGIESLIQEGLIAEQPVEPLSHLIFGALTEAALVLARADDIAAARAEVGASIERLLDGLRVDRPS